MTIKYMINKLVVDTVIIGLNNCQWRPNHKSFISNYCSFSNCCSFRKQNISFFNLRLFTIFLIILIRDKFTNN